MGVANDLSRGCPEGAPGAAHLDGSFTLSLRSSFMSKHGTADIRNIALIGGPHSGKTTLVESILLLTGSIGRAGSVGDGNTVCDFEPEEKEKGHSLRSAMVHFDHKGRTYHLFDAPGYPDFVGEAVCAVAGVETTLLCVNAAQGVTFPARKAWDLAGNMGRARGIVVTHCDTTEFDPAEMVASMTEAFGTRCLAVNWPKGTGDKFEGVDVVPLGPGDSPAAGLRSALIEAAVEIDEDAMTKFLEEDILPEAPEAAKLLTRSIVAGELVPVFFVNALDGKGAEELLEFAKTALPSPADGPFFKDEEDADIAPDAEGATVVVHKILIDAFVGKLAMLRVVSGEVNAGDTFKLHRTSKNEKLAHLQVMHGKEHSEVGKAVAGDLIAVAKLEDLEINDTLTNGPDRAVAPFAFPKPMAARAIEPKNHADDIKLSTALRKTASEDPAFSFERDENTGELVVHGTSIMHIEALLKRIKERSSVEVDVKIPRVALKETITGPADGHHRHKKQTGGRGQFAEVFLSVEPAERGTGLDFRDETVGGSVPKQFIPAIEKGVRESMTQGIIAGYTVVDVCVKVKDGKFHDVDSDEASFKLAGARAFRDGFQKARPVLLEPLLDLQVAVPSRFMGAITSDMTGRRGQISGMDSMGDIQIINARVPQREVLTYPTVLHSLTSGEGHYAAEFHDYEVVPANVQQEIMAEYKPKEDED